MKKTIIFGLIFLVVLAIFAPFPARTDLDTTDMPSIGTTGDGVGQQMTEIPVESVQDVTPSKTIPDLSGETVTGSEITPPIGDIFIPQSRLIISEVFFDGSDEWFEIANVGSGDFLGSLIVQGVKSSDLQLNSVIIPSGGVFIRGDNMTQVTDKTIIRGSGLGLSISDSNPLTVSLFSSGQLLDLFSADVSLVSSLPNGYGLEKIRSGGVLYVLPVTTGRILHVSSGLIANPGYVFTSSEKLSANPQPPLPTSETGGVFITGNTNMPTIPSTGQIINHILFSEIHAGADMLPEYAELYFPKMFVGSLVIGGLGSSSSNKTVSLYAITGQYIVLTDGLSGFMDQGPVYLLDSISLTDGGESLFIKDISGNVYDEIVYTGSAAAHARYRLSGNSFSLQNYLTPGYSEKSLTYLPLISSSSSVVPLSKGETSYYESLYNKRKDRYYDLKAQLGAFDISVNTAGMAYKKLASSSEIELISGTEDFVEHDTIIPDLILRIHAILPDADGKDEGNEQISIELLSGENMDLSNFFILAGSKKSYLTGTLGFSGDKHMFKGTFGFTNKPACASLMHGEVVFDTFCYGQPKAGIRISTTGNIAPEISTGGTDFTRMNKFHLKLFTGQTCALFEDTLFQCISLKGFADEKIKANHEKKMASLQSKFEKKQHQYTGLQERYKNMKTTLDIKRRKYYAQVKSVRNSYKLQLASSKLETKIWKSFGELLQKDLKSNRKMVRQDGDIAYMKRLLDMNTTTFKKNGTSGSIVLYGQKFKIGDIKKQFTFTTDPGVVLDVLIGKGLDATLPKLGNVRNTRLTHRYAEQ